MEALNVVGVLVRLCKIGKRGRQDRPRKLSFKAQMEGRKRSLKEAEKNQGGKPGDKGRRKWFTLFKCVTTSRSFKYF